MNEMPSAWIPVFISSGILVIGSVSLLTKSILDKKEERVKFYEERYKTEKEIASEGRKKFSEAVEEIREYLKDIDANKLDPVSSMKLRDAINISEQISGDLTKLSDDCKKAAEWFDKQKRSWVNVAFKEAIKNSSNSIPFSKRRAFKSDIQNYFEWVHICLCRGGTRTTSLSKHVDIPAIPSATPYILGIEYALKEEEWNGLTYQQKEIVQTVMKRLIELIRKKANQSLTSS